MVDEALADAIPVSPKGKMIYLVALILGIALPVVVIYIIELLKYKIEGRADVENHLPSHCGRCTPVGR